MRQREIRYNGTVFQTEREARWAVFFDCLGITYRYRDSGFIPAPEGGLKPRFYLPNFHCYFDAWDHEEKGEEKYTCNMYDAEGWALIVAFGDPWDNHMYIFCEKVDDSGGGEYSGEVIFGREPGQGTPCLLVLDDYRERDFYDYAGEDMVMIPMHTLEEGKYQTGDIVTVGVRHAEEYSRLASFEHWEAIIRPGK